MLAYVAEDAHTIREIPCEEHYIKHWSFIDMCRFIQKQHHSTYCCIIPLSFFPKMCTCCKLENSHIDKDIEYFIKLSQMPENEMKQLRFPDIVSTFGYNMSCESYHSRCVWNELASTSFPQPDGYMNSLNLWEQSVKNGDVEPQKVLASLFLKVSACLEIRRIKHCTHSKEMYHQLACEAHIHWCLYGPQEIASSISDEEFMIHLQGISIHRNMATERFLEKSKQLLDFVTKLRLFPEKRDAMVDTLFELTEMTALADSVGEGYSYCGSYNQERFVQELVDVNGFNYCHVGFDLFEISEKYHDRLSKKRKRIE